MITYNNKDILKFFIGNKRVVRKYLNNKIVYGTPDFAQYYNIQGYDNYEVVGSPTIIDGVLSNFNASNHLKFSSQTFNPGSGPFEIQLDYTTGNSATSYGYSLCLPCININQPGGVGRFRVNITTTTETFYLQTNRAANTNYLLKVVYDGNGLYALYSNGVLVDSRSSTQLNTISATFDYTIGIREDSVGAKIDLNHTYIKVNGEYLFNGNPNYKELLDCNPNVYLQSSGAQYIDTGVTADNTLSFDITFKNKDLSSTRYFMYNSDGWGNKMFSLLWYVPYSQFIFYLQSSDYYMYQVLSNTSQASDKIRLVSETTSAIRSFQTYINGVLIKSNTHAEAVSFSQHNILIGNTGYLGYAVKLCKNGVLIRHFVPVPQGLQIGSYKVPSNGMFDIITQTFFENKGSGEFIWGVDL